MHNLLSMKFVRVLAVAAAVSCASVMAEEDEKAEASSDAVPTGAVQRAVVFTHLIACRSLKAGSVAVLRPQATAWEPVDEGSAYEPGSAFRVGGVDKAAPDVTFAFGPELLLTATADCEFGTRPVAIDDQGATPMQRTVELRAGTFSLNLPRTLKDGSFNVVAPYFVCSNLCGESSFTYAAKPEGGDESVVRCLTGSMSLAGRHYSIARMGAANQIRIRSTADDLFTSLRGESGDYEVTLDAGTVQQKNFETGEVKDVEKTLVFSLAPQRAIKIFRAKSPIGGRMSVSLMTIDASGEIKNRCAYSEHRSNVNSGELVVTLNAADATTAKNADKASEETEEVDVSKEEKKDSDESKDAKEE